MSVGGMGGGSGLPSKPAPLPTLPYPHTDKLLPDFIKGREWLRRITSFSAEAGGELWPSPSLPLTVTPITAPALV